MAYALPLSYVGRGVCDPQFSQRVLVPAGRHPLHTLEPSCPSFLWHRMRLRGQVTPG